jgi:adenosylcobinamide-GDP ribazoletransferase
VLADLFTAVRLLTVVPLGRTEGGRALRFFPAVGWMFGGLWLGIAWLAREAGLAEGTGALLTGAIAVVASGMLSGLMHWDGLADCADGIGVRGDAARRLEVLRSSTVGAFGVTAIVFVALLQVVAFSVILESGVWWGLAAAPVLGRAGATLAAGLREPARRDGLGARYSVRMSVSELLVATLPVLPLLGWRPESHTALTVATALGLLLAFVVPGPFVRRFGGVTGDVLGATIILTETAVLVAAAVVGGPL